MCMGNLGAMDAKDACSVSSRCLYGAKEEIRIERDKIWLPHCRGAHRSIPDMSSIRDKSFCLIEEMLIFTYSKDAIWVIKDDYLKRTQITTQLQRQANPSRTVMQKSPWPSHRSWEEVVVVVCRCIRTVGSVAFSYRISMVYQHVCPSNVNIKITLLRFSKQYRPPRI